MKLIGTQTSPYTRKVRVVLAEKRIECEFEEDAPSDPATRVPQFNPLGKVPVLIMDDGSALYDSRVIVEYLDSASPVSRLLPDINRERVQVKRWEALADGVCDAAVAIVAEKRRSADKQDPAWIERQSKKMERGVLTIAEELSERHWCFGEGYSLADIAVGIALGYLDLRFPELDWRTTYPNVAAHAEKLFKRASFRDTVPAQV
jgi:glutathione S-transferase